VWLFSVGLFEEREMFKTSPYTLQELKIVIQAYTRIQRISTETLTKILHEVREIQKPFSQVCEKMCENFTI
jgi:SepF-like predicted cell division protein (DUF552 family)